MSHQPFETWLLSEEPLDPEQEKALKKHLSTCQQCAALSQAVKNVDDLMTSINNLQPAPGFTQRWHHRLQSHQQLSQQRKVLSFTLSAFALANLIFLALILINFANINPSYQLGQFIASFSLVAARTRQFWAAISNLIDAFPILIPAFALSGLSLFAFGMVLIITWLTSMVNLLKQYPQGVKIK
jgi:hypothetical protein